VWHGGLGIPGGIIGGTLAGLVYVRVKNLPTASLLDVAAPCLPLAQAIGRFGNYFNQEVFGKHSGLPWALEIDKVHRCPSGGIDCANYAYSTFHPTFLYECLWNLGVVALIIWIDRRGKLRRGKLFPLYVGGYFLGRMWVEELRSDPAAKVGTIRWNFVFAIIMVVLAAIWFFWRGPFRRPGDPADPPVGGSTVPGDDGVAEGGPDVEGPRSELPAAEGDEGEVEVGVQPEEGP
jgi:prolipoprotein diacylglyceryl transferase